MFVKSIRILAVVLSLILFLSVAGCSNSTDTTATTTTTRSTTTTAQTTQAPDEMDEKLSIRWIGKGMLEVEDGNITQKYIEDKFNVEIINVRADVFNAEQMNLMIASGEMPDAGFMYQNPMELYKQGVTRSIPGELIRAYAPLYTDLMSEYDSGRLMSKVPDKEDEYTVVIGLDLSLATIAFLPMYRLDWLENVSISPKGELVQLDEDGKIFFTAEPFSKEEDKEIFKRFTFNDPNKSGKNDTYALSGCEYINYSFATLMIERGLFPNNWIAIATSQDDGKDVPILMSDKYKEFLIYMQKLYSEGILDPEWTTLDLTKYWEKITSGLVGYSPTINAYVHPTIADRPPYSVFLADPNAKLLFTGMDYAQQWVTTLTGYNFYVGAQVDDAKLKRILMIFDHINLDQEAQVLTRWGIEGEHYEWEAEPYNSYIESKIDQAESQKNGINVYNHVLYDMRWVTYYTAKEMLPLYEYIANHPNRLYPYRTNVFPTENEFNEVSSVYEAEITTIGQEFYYRAITGEYDINKEWDNYLDSLYAAGMQKVIDELYKMPISSYLLDGEIKY